MVKKIEDTFTRFDSIQNVTDSKTDGETDTARRHRPCLRVASRGKKLTLCIQTDVVFELDLSLS